MMRESRESTDKRSGHERTMTTKPQSRRYCPFNNPNCGVTCECGDIECHRYCVGSPEVGDG